MQTITLGKPELSHSCLANQIILITGASSGIGRALALSAGEHGATVILLGKNLKALESLYDEMMAKGYPEPAIHPLNLLQTGPKQAYELAQSIQQMFGRLDAVIHNAGTAGQISEVEHLSPPKWQEVIQLNLNIPYLLTHALLGLLKASAQSSVLFVTAEEATAPKAYWSAYSASKAGIQNLAASLHEELEANTTIRVNCIHPGKVRTALRRRAYPGIDPESLTAPEDIVPHYIYLLSPEAKNIRGKTVNLA